METVDPTVEAEFKARGDKLRDDYEDAACEAEAVRCLECGFARPLHAPDCESGRHRPGMILVSTALIATEKRRYKR